MSIENVSAGINIERERERERERALLFKDCCAFFGESQEDQVKL